MRIPKEKATIRAFVALLMVVGLPLAGCPGTGTSNSVATNPGASVSCTFGTDCYCDHVLKVGDPLHDPAVLLCEDWEAPTLHDNVGFGAQRASARGSGGTDAYGPWYDDTFDVGTRGSNNYLAQKYASGCGTGGGCWQLGQPVTPKIGAICTSALCNEGEYRFDDLWDANNMNSGAGACVDVIKTGSSNANDEDSALGIPDTPGTSDNRGVWDGKQTFGYRVRPGNGLIEAQACGPLGSTSYSNAVTEIGVTFAMAYGDNTGSLNTVISGLPVKHEEFGNSANSGNQETLAVGNTGLRIDAGFPFAPAHWTTSQAACQIALANAMRIVGDASCSNAPGLLIGTKDTEYTQSIDWPFGKWGCVRVHKSGMGTNNVTIKIWYGNATTEKLVFHLTNFDGTALANQSYDFHIWNSYMNVNSASGGSTGLDGNWRRWIDNYHVRRGEPVSCSQIGFGRP